MSWGACTGDIVPQVEICNSLDDDCDGTVDNMADADKPVCSKHLGVCAGAKQVCSGGNWIDCTESDYQSHSQYYAIVENTNVTCWDGADNDCNGAADANEPFCQPGSGVQPLEPCTLNQMFDANSDGAIDSYDVILLLRQVVLLPNRYVELKPCQAITVQPQ
jgi:hypothetical protein